MRLKSIASHLRPYVMLARRRTTINHAFAAAIAPSDTFDERAIGGAIKLLGQDPARDLECAYCGFSADTWDHVYATVRNSKFSGHGHRLGNLLPCCKPCNSRKGNKPWTTHILSLGLSHDDYTARHDAIERYLATYSVDDRIPDASPDLQRLDDIQREILLLLEDGDLVSARIRAEQIARKAVHTIA